METEVIVALITLIGMEVVLGIDNLVFIAILSNRLPESQRQLARRIGLGLAVLLRFGMLAGTSWLLTLTRPLFEVAGVELSGKDLILLAGGLFLLGKATIEIHHRVTPAEHVEPSLAAAAGAAFWPTVAQIIALDMVFSVDSILAAVGLVREFWMIAVAIVVSVLVMLMSMDRLSAFMEKNPSVVMLALAFLMMIGLVLVAEGLGVHVPKGFVYAAMAFATGVEALNLLANRAIRRRRLNQLRARRASPAGG
ncbi:TerC family protein [Siccirubricoccus sp. G192]|uniref:TerC family protein n=1 Tax=Siccirubricoccus sp. G192 TaxID=2849651 RepID=UPI001C2C0AD3|nr:TerC family protein [Siccirubricoccus sp. G192]MBV1796789.1 TerC family protein [Siccirubricoccus sp. G192]